MCGICIIFCLLVLICLYGMVEKLKYVFWLFGLENGLIKIVVYCI